MIVLGAGAFVALAALGALTRSLLARFDGGVPLGTIGTNTVASFIAGLVAGSAHPTIVVVGLGFCGSLSTFSTLVRHLHDLAATGQATRLMVTLALSLGSGLAAAAVGIALAGA